MVDIKGKTVVVTGASSGIGAAAVRQFHELGAHVVPVGRSARKTAAVADELGVRGYTVDFAALADVHRLADELTSDLPHIDVLAANAGTILGRRTTTVDGIDTMFQVNAVGPWLLMRLLAPRLTDGKVIGTSSGSHTRSVLSEGRLDDLVTSREERRRQPTYGQTKLAGGILLREFGRRHGRITVADFHPGVIATDLVRVFGRGAALARPIAKAFMESPAAGGLRLVQLATTDDDINGRYYDKDRPADGSPLLADQALARRLWDIAEQLAPIDRPPRT